MSYSAYLCYSDKIWVYRIQMNVCIYSYIAGIWFWADQWWHVDLE